MAKIALLIGVSHYNEPSLNPLPRAIRDIKTMRRVLQHPEMGGFTDEDIKVLENPQRQVMEKAIETLFGERSKNDLVLLYFSGHGIKDESAKLYLATRETYKSSKGELVKTSATPASLIHDVMANSRSRQQVIILDCCLSGAFGEGMKAKGDASLDIKNQLMNINKQEDQEGRIVLTSSIPMQYSFEQQGTELSVYTRYLAERIDRAKADTDNYGVISLDELRKYIHKKVQEAAPLTKPGIFAVRELYKIQLAKVLVGDPKLEYRKEVERCIRDGKISVVGRRILKRRQMELGLSANEATLIEDEVLEPFRERHRNLQEYKEAVNEAVQDEGTLSQYTRDELKRLQQLLQLKDEDIAPIHEQILLTSVVTNNHVVDASPNISVTKSADISPPPSLSLQPFEFEVVSVNAQGKQIQRRRGKAEYFFVDLGNGINLDMVFIPGGELLMGSPESELERDCSESPQHKVIIQPFFMGKFPVTQAQWRAVASLPKVNRDLELYPSRFKGTNRPVEQVSWLDAVEFCQRLSRKTGQEFRLPSEAEWEYAARAGTATPFHFGQTITTDLANYCGEDYRCGETFYSGSYDQGPKGVYRQETTDVGSFLIANAFGLYDMHGLVWEWCLDQWHDNYQGAPNNSKAWLVDNDNENDHRLLRGGSWNAYPWNCRSACRGRYPLANRVDVIGFRVVCVPAFSPPSYR